MYIGRGIPTGRVSAMRSATTTGTVWSDIVMDQDGTRALTMFFAPGSRTHWHSHPGGQLLYTLAGEGWIQERDGQGAILRPGDVCWTQPGVEHWHGASEHSQLVQFVLHFGDVAWTGPVADTEYVSPAEEVPGR
ncbi:cupin domain-containing protein [Streptomyces sp. NPDC004629]|uniref:cupin domain-containing protein n=1 Tax=Streptomyces sp. NPDC004629 TaxID=3364705 RepID=UPI00367E30EB